MELSSHAFGTSSRRMVVDLRQHGAGAICVYDEKAKLYRFNIAKDAVGHSGLTVTRCR